MSKTSIPADVRRELWFEAHGRCEMCNKPLYRDGLTMMDVNLGEYAHIIGDSPNGPRGHFLWSKKKSMDKDNLILLCKDHHKVIDDAGGVKMFGVELLRQIKKTHEARIELVTSISPNHKTLVVCYTPKVGDKQTVITDSTAYNTIIPEYYPMTTEPVRLDASNVPYDDNRKMYWEIHPDILKENFKEKIEKKIKDIAHISLFAFAPQPLLTLLGSLLSDMYPVEVMQKHREPDTWKWLNPKNKVDNHFKVIEPKDNTKEAAIVFAISGTEIIDRIKTQFKDTISCWIVTCETPDRDMLKTREQLSEFRTLVRNLINDINTLSSCKSIKIFPAMPISCAIELGRIRLPKSDNPWIMYDLPKFEDTEYIETITIQ